jgi:transcriptional regulator with PAS, ATPase and Fis domain
MQLEIPTEKSESDALIVHSQSMKLVLRIADRVASTDHPVLILGETGVGKDLIAERIFRQSARCHRDFVRLNCAAIPSDLFEAELFGNEVGSFSGAVKRREGLIETADKGVLFLDEVCEMSLGSQAKMLRALESGEFYRLGGRRPVKSDFRLLSAMNRNPMEAVGGRKMREDFLYRLAVITIHVPPLRERPEDIEPLIDHFVRKHSGSSDLRIRSEDLDRMTSYPWPGNVRELRNRILSAIVLEEDGYLNFADQGVASVGSSLIGGDWQNSNGLLSISDSQRILIESTIRHFGGNRAKASQALGISESTLYRRLRDFK